MFLKMLLSYGADPNIRVVGDIATNAVLRPPLAELIASNEDVKPEELRLLMKYGARVSFPDIISKLYLQSHLAFPPQVILKTQFRDPEGILNCLTHMDPESDSFRIILEAAEEFDPCMIRRNQQLNDDQRMLLLERATIPMPLKSRVRAHFRRLFGRSLPEFVPSLFIPKELQSYLLYEHSF